MIPSICQLTQEQRQAARRAAQETVIHAIGAKPTRERFCCHDRGGTRDGFVR